MSETVEKPRDIAVSNPFGVSKVQRDAPTAGLVSVEQQRAIAEVQARMIIARANPRDPMRAMDAILRDCTRSSLAERALYQYSRGGSDISGPSIRLAEAIAQRWGNIASGIREVSRSNGYSECIAYAWDLETGFYDERQFQVRHWRDTKSGGHPIREERDIYELVANLGQRRKRAVLLTVIPGDVTEAATAQCEQTLNANADVSPAAVKKMVAAFADFGVTEAQIVAKCQRRLDAIRPAQVVMLRKIYSSLKDEMSRPEDWFDPAPSAASETAPAVETKGTEALKRALATSTKKEAAAKDEGKEEASKPVIPAADRDSADRILADLKETPDDYVEEYSKTRAVHDAMAGWKTDLPELFAEVDAAFAARMKSGAK